MSFLTGKLLIQISGVIVIFIMLFLIGKYTKTPAQRERRSQDQQEYLRQRETQPLNAPRDEEGAFISWDGTTINSSWVERNSPQLSASKFVNQNFEATKRYEEQTKAIMGDNFGKPTTAQSHDLRTAA